MLIESAGELGRLLRGTMLEGREVDVLHTTASGKQVFSVPIHSEDEVLPAWRSSRQLVPQTGRWPVVGGEWWALSAGELSELPRASPHETALAATSVIADLAEDSARAFHGIDGWTGTYKDFLVFHLNNTKHRCGTAPSESEVEAGLPASASDVALDRWLMQQEERRQPTTVAERGAHLQWFFEPAGASVVFTPTADGPSSLAFSGFWGYEPTDEHGPHRSLASLITVLRYWEDRYGAELVATWGTVLEFVVERPPQTLEDAWNLAREHDLIAGDTFARAGLATRADARALINRTDWFLHNRP